MAPPVGRRGHNLFKAKDGLRVIKIARDGGMKPAMLEIAAKDGTTYRVYDQEAPAAKQAARPPPSLPGTPNPTDDPP
jgi:hypothetical protein